MPDAQSQTSTKPTSNNIYGQVNGDAQSPGPIVDAAIILKRDGEKIAVLHSDDNGYYNSSRKYPELPEGHYDIIVAKHGYSFPERNTVDLHGSSLNDFIGTYHGQKHKRHAFHGAHETHEIDSEETHEIETEETRETHRDEINITGTVYGEKGTDEMPPPVRGVQIFLEFLTQSEEKKQKSRIVKQTNAQGNFSFDDVEPGQYTLHFRDKKLRSTYASIHISVADKSPEPLKIYPHKNKNSLSGFVVGEKNKRLSGMQIKISGNVIGRNMILSFTTNSFGFFTTGGKSIFKGMYSVSCTDPTGEYTFVGKTVKLESGPAHITLVGTKQKNNEPAEPPQDLGQLAHNEITGNGVGIGILSNVDSVIDDLHEKGHMWERENPETKEYVQEAINLEKRRVGEQAYNEISSLPGIKIENHTSVDTLMPHLQNHGWQDNDLTKAFVHGALQHAKTLPPPIPPASTQPTQPINPSPSSRPNIPHARPPQPHARNPMGRGANKAGNKMGQQAKKFIQEAAKKLAKEAVKKAAIAAIGSVGWPVILVVIAVIAFIIIVVIIFSGGGSSPPPHSIAATTSDRSFNGNDTTNSGTDTIPNLTLSKTGPPQAENGQDLEYTITVNYSGTLDVTIQDQITDNATITSASGKTDSKNDHIVTWKLQDPSNAASNGVHTFTVKAHPTANDVYVKNSVQATAPGGNTSKIPIPNLTITKTGPDKTENKQEFQYAISVNYSGDKEVSVFDKLPAQVKYKDASGTKNFDSSTNTVSWKLKDNTGSNGAYNFTCTVTADQDDSVAKNSAYATAPGGGGDIAACGFYRGSNSTPVMYNSPKLLSYFQEAESLSGVPAVLLAAIAKVESNGPGFTDQSLDAETCPGGHSPTGATGLMQIEPAGQTGNDPDAIALGAKFLGKNYADLTESDYCNPKESIILAAGFVIKKMQYVYNGDGKTWNPSWTSDQNAIYAIARAYYGALEYSGGNYGEDLWNSISNCHPTPGSSGTSSDQSHSCPIQATFVPYSGVDKIGQGQYSYICEHCGSSSASLPTYNSIDMLDIPSGGLEVHAVTDGTVDLYHSAQSGPGLFLNGNDGKVYFYVHLKEAGRVEGKVTKGQIIGSIASSTEIVEKPGNNGVSHVHIQATTNGNNYNPNIPIGPLLDQWCGNDVCHGHQKTADECEMGKNN